MFYVMSDIHGCFDAFKKMLAHIPLFEGDKLILLGDYIDYGPQSAEVLKAIIDLQKQYKEGTVVALKGNHEDQMISWLAECRSLSSSENHFIENDWLGENRLRDYCSFRTLITKDQWEEFIELEKRLSSLELNRIAAKMVKETSGDLIEWIKDLPLYYETDKQIFVHAGIDEEAEDLWQFGTSDEMFMWKYPPAEGEFYKMVIAGHVGTCEIAGDNDYHDIYYDGESHIYIDGSVYKEGRLCLLAIDDRNDNYYEISDNGYKKPIITGDQR